MIDEDVSKIRGITVVSVTFIAALFGGFWVHTSAVNPDPPVEPCTACIEGLNETWDCSAVVWQDKGMCERARETELGKCMKLCGESE